MAKGDKGAVKHEPLRLNLKKKKKYHVISKRRAEKKCSVCNFSLYVTGECMDMFLGLHVEFLLAHPWKL